MKIEIIKSESHYALGIRWEAEFKIPEKLRNKWWWTSPPLSEEAARHAQNVLGSKIITLFELGCDMHIVNLQLKQWLNHSGHKVNWYEN